MDDWQIIVATIGFFGILLAALAEAIGVVNFVISPIKEKIDTLRSDIDITDSTISDLRERITYLEAKQNGQPR